MIVGVRCSTVSSASDHTQQRTQFCLQGISQRTQPLCSTKHNSGDRSRLDLHVQFPLFSPIVTKIITWGQIRPTKVWSSSGNRSIKKETSVPCCRHWVLLNHYDTLHFIGPVTLYWSLYNLLAPLYFIGPITPYWSHYTLLVPLYFIGSIIILVPLNFISPITLH